MGDDGGEEALALVDLGSGERAREREAVGRRATDEQLGQRERELGGIGVLAGELREQGDRLHARGLVDEAALVVQEADAEEEAIEEGPQDHEAGVLDVELVRARAGATWGRTGGARGGELRRGVRGGGFAGVGVGVMRVGLVHRDSGRAMFGWFGGWRWLELGGWRWLELAGGFGGWGWLELAGGFGGWRWLELAGVVGGWRWLELAGAFGGWRWLELAGVRLGGSGRCWLARLRLGETIVVGSGGGRWFVNAAWFAELAELGGLELGGLQRRRVGVGRRLRRCDVVVWVGPGVTIGAPARVELGERSGEGGVQRGR